MHGAHGAPVIAPHVLLADMAAQLRVGEGLAKGDPRLLFRRVMFSHTRKQAGQPMRRRETREHVTLYLKAFNAWATDTALTQLKYTPREPVPPIATGR